MIDNEIHGGGFVDFDFFLKYIVFPTWVILVIRFILGL